MNPLDLDKAYVSPYDRFMRKFDATHEKTESQIVEILKHQRIAQLRDETSVVEEVEIWGGF